MASFPPNLGVYTSSSSSGNIFGVSSNPMGDATLPSNPPFHAQPLSLLPSTSANFFGVSSANSLTLSLLEQKPATLADFLNSGTPKPEASIGNLFLDIATDLTHLNQEKTAYDMGRALHEGQKAMEESGGSSLESVTCQTAKVVAETAFGTVGTAVLLGGTGLLITESVAFPPLAATIPLAAAALPQAYANVEALSKFAGKKAEQDCHLLFSGD